MDIDHKHAFDGKQDKNFYQKPFDDVTDALPQMDEQSATLADRKDNAAKTTTDADKPGQAEKSGTTDASDNKDAGVQATEINDDDVRDQGDSAEDWDAEQSKTGRHK